MIEIKHLTKKYGKNVAVNDLNLTLEPGNIYGFLGPNGAGKSTTMNIITGYIGATSGEVIVNGYDINKEPEKAKQCIGYLPELPPLYGDMKVIEYLNFVADLKKLNKHTREADLKYTMDLTKLHAMKNRLIRNLSKGYKQRVGLAQALMGMPEVIILDEPTVGLDPKQIIEIRELILSLKERHTVILSSHILQEISAVCDHVFIISEGNLVASDTMEHLEEQMSGAQQLTLLLKAKKEDAEQLASVAGVQSCEVTEKEKAVSYQEAPEMEPVAEVEEDVNAETEETVEVEEAIAQPEESVEITAETEISEESVETTAEAEVSEVTQLHVELSAAPGMDIREAVFCYCAANNLVILEMNSVSKSLEDVFLALTEAKEV